MRLFCQVLRRLPVPHSVVWVRLEWMFGIFWSFFFDGVQYIPDASRHHQSDDFLNVLNLHSNCATKFFDIAYNCICNYCGYDNCTSNYFDGNYDCNDGYHSPDD